MFALADCNNFFVSCERVFRPDLEGKPVIVLSRNDGCAIARSNEAKRVGVKMGDPLFKIQDLIKQHDITVFSGNMSLYADFSRRVRTVLRSFVPHIEVYSIDEAFLDMRGMEHEDLNALAKDISKECRRLTGIPLSIGVAPTKTLAKVASKLCKQYPKLQGGCYMYREQDIEKVLHKFPIEDIWGIGRCHTPRLKAINVNSAYDFCKLSETWVRSNMGITGLRTWRELHGIPSIEFEHIAHPKQSICNSRSFSSEIFECDELSEQVAKFAALTAEKLREQRSVCSSLTIFAATNRFREDELQQYGNIVIPFTTPTNSTLHIVRTAREAICEIFIKGCGYKRAGVIATNITPMNSTIMPMFDCEEHMLHQRLMNAVDNINRKVGHNAIIVASQGLGEVKAHNRYQSPCYTTDWNDIPIAKLE